MRRIATAFTLAAAFTVAIAAPALAEPRTVNCAAGDSLQAAIDRADSETPLEVFGVCHDQVVIDRPLTIIGGEPGAGIDGSGTGGNTVTIESDAVFLRDLTIFGAEKSETAPDATGHGVFDDRAHTFTLLRVTVEGNEGAGILMYDSYLTITHSRIRNNGSNGIALLGGCCGIVGADSITVRGNGSSGIFTTGDQSLVLTNSKVKRNGGVGVFTNEDGYIADSVIRYNGSGVGSFGTGRIVRSRVVDNGGWGVSWYDEVIDSVVSRNGRGGVEEARVIDGSRIRGNGGPGVATTIETGIFDSVIARNLVTGIVAESDLVVSGSLISRNAGAGAGALQVGGEASVINTTIRRNSATSGAAVAVTGTLTVVSSTIYRNSGPGGVFANSGTVSVQGSIVYGHSSAANHCSGTTVTSAGYNVVAAPGCSWDITDILADPLLGPLAHNGGRTATHSLQTGSPAIDFIPVSECLVAVDQRGEPRPRGAGCDSGAFEVQSATIQPD